MTLKACSQPHQIFLCLGDWNNFKGRQNEEVSLTGSFCDSTLDFCLGIFSFSEELN